MKINLQKIRQILFVVGLLLLVNVFSTNAQPQTYQSSKVVRSSNIVYKEIEMPFRLEQNASSWFQNSPLVTGIGQLTLSGGVAVGDVSGDCCARVKITITRLATAETPTTSVIKEQTLEICGSQTFSISENLSANQDDARFQIKFENLDRWNKKLILPSFRTVLRYPTADRILTGQPSLKFNLSASANANRQFTLSPNTPGKLTVKVIYRGSTRVRVTLKKPDGSDAGTVVEGTSGLQFTYDITPGDITSGNIWSVNVLNLTNTSATDVDVSVVYTVEQ